MFQLIRYTDIMELYQLHLKEIIHPRYRTQVSDRLAIVLKKNIAQQQAETTEELVQSLYRLPYTYFLIKSRELLCQACPPSISAINRQLGRLLESERLELMQKQAREDDRRLRILIVEEGRGELAHILAIRLYHNMREKLNFEIDAIDSSKYFNESADGRVFSPEEAGQLGFRTRLVNFEKVEGGYQPSPVYSHCINFIHLDLLNELYAPDRKYDLIICSTLRDYYHDEVNRHFVEQVLPLLSTEGFIYGGFRKDPGDDLTGLSPVDSGEFTLFAPNNDTLLGDPPAPGWFQHPVPSVYKINALYADQGPAGALEYMDVLLGGDRESHLLTFCSGDLKFNLNDYPGARDLYTRGLKLMPECLPLSYNAAICALMSDRYDEALEMAGSYNSGSVSGSGTGCDLPVELFSIPPGRVIKYLKRLEEGLKKRDREKLKSLFREVATVTGQETPAISNEIINSMECLKPRARKTRRLPRRYRKPARAILLSHAKDLGEIEKLFKSPVDRGEYFILQPGVSGESSKSDTLMSLCKTPGGKKEPRQKIKSVTQFIDKLDDLIEKADLIKIRHHLDLYHDMDFKNEMIERIISIIDLMDCED